MRLRRRSETEAPEAPGQSDPPPAAGEARAPVTEAAFLLRQIVDAIPVGDRERIWSRVVARVEAEIQRRDSNPDATDRAGADADSPPDSSAA